MPAAIPGAREPRRRAVLVALALALPIAGCGRAEPQAPTGPVAEMGAAPDLVLREWERGIAVAPADGSPMDMYLWFWEWNLFGAFEEGLASKGTYELERWVAADGRAAGVRAPEMELEMRVVEPGEVRLDLLVRNRTERPFGELAGFIPCFNPGPADVRNQEMAHHHSTWCLAAEGLTRMPAREAHWRSDLRPLVDRAAEAAGGALPFSKKWPTSEVDSTGGLALREARSGEWVTAIAWEDWLGVQAHNPWQCMHLAVRVGPLAAGAERRIAGRIYLMRGDRDAVLARYREDFPRN